MNISLRPARRLLWALVAVVILAMAAVALPSTPQLGRDQTVKSAHGGICRDVAAKPTSVAVDVQFPNDPDWSYPDGSGPAVPGMVVPFYGLTVQVRGSSCAEYDRWPSASNPNLEPTAPTDDRVDATIVTGETGAAIPFGEVIGGNTPVPGTLPPGGYFWIRVDMDASADALAQLDKLDLRLVDEAKIRSGKWFIAEFRPTMYYGLAELTDEGVVYEYAGRSITLNTVPKSAPQPPTSTSNPNKGEKCTADNSAKNVKKAHSKNRPDDVVKGCHRHYHLNNAGVCHVHYHKHSLKAAKSEKYHAHRGTKCRPPK